MEDRIPVAPGWRAPSRLERLRSAWRFSMLAQRSGQPVLVARNPALRPYAGGPAPWHR